jgi:murein DD-endopeptidase MepM/ murein hydrolase activator NlpD
MGKGRTITGMQSKKPFDQSQKPHDDVSFAWVGRSLLRKKPFLHAMPKVIAASFWLFSSLAWTQTGAPPARSDAQAQKPPMPIQIVIPTPPTAFRADTQWRLCYEIYLTNLSSATWTLQRIEVKNESGAPLLTVQGKELDDVLSHPALPPDSKGGPAAEIAAGEAVIAYMWIDLAKDAAIPKHLQHQFGLKNSGDKNNYELDAPMTEVSNKLPGIVPPLRGKDWVAISGPSNSSVHRRSMQVFDGTPRIAQRYAIDWVRLGDSGKTYHGDRGKNGNYYSYGAEVIAVADGVVIEVKDGIPENTPPADSKDGTPPAVTLAVDMTMETVGGNHVNLDLGGGVYAIYAHLQPGSIRVKPGDKVTPGQVIALLGNSGHAGEPHLHFQLMDRNSLLNSDGLPYYFTGFKLTGQISGDSEGQPTEAPANLKVNRLPAPEAHHGDIPLENEVVDFEP